LVTVQPDLFAPSPTCSASPISKVMAWPLPNFIGIALDRVATAEPYFTLPSHGSRISLGRLRSPVSKVAIMAPYKSVVRLEQPPRKITQRVIITGLIRSAPLKRCAVALLLTVLGALSQPLSLLSKRLLVRSGKEQLGILISNPEPGLNASTKRISLRRSQLLLKSRDPIRRLLRLGLIGLLQFLELLSLLLKVRIIGILRPLPLKPVLQRRVQLILTSDRLKTALTLASTTLLLTTFKLSQCSSYEPPVNRRRPRNPHHGGSSFQIKHVPHVL